MSQSPKSITKISQFFKFEWNPNIWEPFTV
jgi:hypothetical protein